MPAVSVDSQQLDQNIKRFHQQVAAAGCTTRAHLKAHRTIELAVRQVAAGAVGVAVHSAQAALDLAAAGVTDVVVAWPWQEPWRWPLYVKAAHELKHFAVHVDTAETITGLGRVAAADAVQIGIRIDLRHTPAADLLLLARLADATAGVHLEGLTGYRGPETPQDIVDFSLLGQSHAEHLVEVAESIRAEGIDCPVVSAGGTPTAAGALRVAGVTEIVAGAYATLDAGLATAGACDLTEVAISVANDRADLLTDCGQPWAPESVSVPVNGRLVPGHVCPLAKNLMRGKVEITVLDGGVPVDRWLPRGRPDRE
ncbi:alanine racemase [Streptomyces sp. SID13031]|uniref:alanine racemase n=1 Tax=Streptomyces sp. SID13031 TaxID=2706046 RepID=UPI0013CD9CFB|nr:alanine racemase [Streptomyces sp. SID13031]NEA30522.1 alanine racemase [Streptomyces sp. SID13031]